MKDYKQNERKPCECGELLGPGGVAYAVKFRFFQRVEFAFIHQNGQEMKKTFVTLLIALSASAHGYAQTSSEAVSKAERNTIRQGNEYFEKGNYAKALEAYETALRLNTTSQVATYNKALALLNMASEDTKGSENKCLFHFLSVLVKKLMCVSHPILRSSTSTSTTSRMSASHANVGNCSAPAV